MKISLSNREIYPDFENLHGLFHKNGHEIRLVGGCVRDILMGYSVVSDYDFCTTMLPEKMLELSNRIWEVLPTGLDHGTVTFRNKTTGKTYEITTLRVDQECDGRHAIVEFTDSWKDDAARRDLTINAMSVDITGEVYDYFGGIKDIKQEIIMFVGNPFERIKEDYLRIIRAIRLSVKLKFKIHPDTVYAIIKTLYADSPLTDRFAGERLIQEIKKQPEPQLIHKLWEFGLFKNLGIGVEFYHSQGCYDNFGEFISQFLPSMSDLDSLHEKCKLSNEEYILASWVIKQKDKYSSETSIPFKDFKRMKWVDKVSFDSLIILSQWKYPIHSDWLENFGFEWESISFEDKEFPVRGQDLIDIGYKPGPIFSDILNSLLEKWVESDYTWTRTKLLESLV